MTASLAYRKNEAAIWRGDAPEKYTRLLRHIPGDRVVELGSAEGVLALLMARQGKAVTAVEANPARHAAAIRLSAQWRRIFPDFGDVTFLNAAAGESLAALDTADTLVAVRMIYYLRAGLDDVFSAVAAKVPSVVLCGNRNRASFWQQGIPDEAGGPVNYYASAAGMSDLLLRHGYSIVTVIDQADPIVVGRKDV